jgi:NADH-quinone oxidoreductase subunit J
MTFLSPILLHFLGAFRTGTAFLVLAVQNPVHALLLLIRLFSLGTLFLFTLQREYFAILFLIVYVGAIVVLFLFLIRRLELKRLNGALRLRDLLSSRYRVVLLLVLELLLLLDSDRPVDISSFYSTSLSDSRNPFFDWSASLQHTGPLQAFGGLLYTEYKVAFLLAAALLLLSRVGALVLTLALLPSSETPSGVESYESFTRKRQDRNAQARRHPSFAPRLSRSVF